MQENGFWVFGYGSLLWKPGFAFAEKKQARLNGFRRAFCMYSIHYRGTVANPGLVLALDPHDTACCDGVAYRVPAETAAKTLNYLRERELVSSAYYEDTHPVTLECGTNVDALCYIVDRDHEQYTGVLSLETQADMIARSAGSTGPNWEYLFKTAEHLAALGIADAEMESLVKMVSQRRA
ncbi:MAG: gamma-glutamylcyclotransferase [Rhodobacteraceae bacterium]|nr:gamma-glutamylcyclotransferase [Paracoccaceae bacterium]